jgi:NAD(P)-dependent dehydrogenase (short-subunit alcohol dehydrogenase family)
MNPHELHGRVAVVIGGAGGVGRGIALAFLAEGMRVVVADIDPDGASAVVDEASRRGATPDETLQAEVDSTDRRSLEALADAAVTRFGAVHILVNTVGVIFDGDVTSATDEDWLWTFELNVLSQVRAVQAFLPRLRAAQGLRHVVTTASMAGLVTPPPEMRTGLYAATKHALVAYSERLRMELAGDEIGVSVLCPTRVVGNLAATSARERWRRLGQRTPEGWGAPPDPQDRVPGESLGPLVVAAINANRFFVCNRPDALLSAFEERHRRLSEDLAFLSAIESR